MTQAIKKRIMRFISCLLVITILLPSVAQLPVFGETNTLNSNNEEVILESGQDALSPNSAGDWWIATSKDGFAWNYFHNEVQKEIRDKNRAMLNKELEINFNQLVENPVTGKKSKLGKADLSMEIGEVTYIWEVKPASYLIEPKKGLGEKQLGNYLESKLRVNSDKIYVNGGTTSYIGSNNFDRTAPSGAKYKI